MLPIDWAPMRIFKRTADVNLWGLIEMTKTFLPLVKMARGRVVNFASVGGKLLACEQALLFGQAKRASRERASEGPPCSRETRFTRPNRRACSQASKLYKGNKLCHVHGSTTLTYNHLEIVIHDMFSSNRIFEHKY